jgi:hypothetical protein
VWAPLFASLELTLGGELDERLHDRGRISDTRDQGDGASGSAGRS